MPNTVLKNCANFACLFRVLGVILLTLLSLSDGCGPGRKLSDLRKYVQFENYRGADGVARSPSCLSCNFNDGETCCWYDDASAPLHWQKTRFKQTVTPKQMKDVTGRSDLPNGEFLAAGSETGRLATDSANLIADVPCLDDNSKLSMRYWKSSDNPILEVCTECPNAAPVCTQAPHSRISPHPIDFAVGCRGEVKGPARLLIKGRGYTQPDFIAIDDVNFSGQFCNSESTGTAGRVITEAPGPGVTGSATNALLNGCSSLTCDFERGNTCGWGPARAGDFGQWNVNSGREGAPVTGIFGDATGNKDGKFAFVGRTTPDKPSSGSDASTTYVLQSPRFRTKVPAKLKYRLFDHSVGPVFQVCTDDALTNCQNQVDKPQLGGKDNPRWVDEQSIDLQPNTPYTISYVVKSIRSNLYVGLDNIKLEPQGGDNSACVAA